MPPLPPTDDTCAFFFDFDGTLADIAEHPEAVEVVHTVPAALLVLQQRVGGAVAVISGRPVAEIDEHLAPARLPAAGVHGSERRLGDGRWERVPPLDLAAVRPQLQRWCEGHAGTWLEVKPGALAMHYRGADVWAEAAAQAMAEAQAQVPGSVLLHGKKVIELKPAAADKGRAVAAFMAEPPFAGRRPWFFGDDVTDEAAFRAVQALGGVAVKIGDGETEAGWRLADPAALRDWLTQQTTKGQA
jgi:trehalose 6-phosphate phosphatase